MKKQSYLSKSRYLLLFLFALIVGTGSAWADTLTEDFESTTVSGDPVSSYVYNELSNGWKCIGDGTVSIYNGWAVYGLTSDYARSGKGLWSNSSSASTSYIVIPTRLTGTVEFYVRQINKNAASIQVFEAVVSGVTYEATGSALAEKTYDKISSGSASSTFVKLEVPLGTAGKMLAIQLVNAAMDDFSGTIYEDITGPKLGVYSDNEATSGVSSPLALDYGLVAAAQSSTYYLKNKGIGNMNVAIKATGGYTVKVGDGAASASISAFAVATDATTAITIYQPAGSSNGTITLTATDASDDSEVGTFTINASGTVRDPNKVYLDFSDGKMPSGWTSVQTGSYSSYPWTATTGSVGTSGNYSSYQHAFTSPKLTFAESEKVYFKTQKYNSSAYYTTSLKVEYSTDGSTWTTIGSAYTDDTYGNWTQRSVTIPTADAKYIRFNGYNMRLTEIYGGKLADDPQNLAVSDVTKTTATITWEAGRNSETAWELYYGTTNTPGSGTKVDISTTPEKALSGLSAGTVYYVYIRGVKGVDDYTDWSDALVFATPIASYPYTENFNGLTTANEIPVFWNNSEGDVDVSNASRKWCFNTSISGNGATKGTSHDASNCVRFDSYNNSNGVYNFLKTRPFSVTQGKNMKLTFWYKNPAGGDFSVYVSADGGTTKTVIASGLTSQSSWTDAEYTIDGNTIYGDNVVILFKGTSNYGSGDAYIYLDDVTLNEVNDYAMSISGSDVVSNAIAFGTVKNTTTTKTFTISNDGTEDLTSISVVSSDDAIFTVSETGFDIAAGETKDITVTFIKGVEANYSETITISQANVSDKELTVTATYQAPTPATMGVTISAAAVGETVAFGTVNKSTTKTFTVANTGEATLNATIGLSGTDAANFALSTTSLVVAGGESETFDVTFDSDDEDVAKTAVVTLSAAGLSDVSFNVTGTYSNFWTEDFNEATGLPTGWITTNWTIGTYSDYENKTKMALAASGNNSGTLITPRLYAKKDEVLTWDAYYHYYDEKIKVEWSNDGSSWTEFINDAYANSGSYSSTYHKQMSFTAPADGNYYLRFTSTYQNGIDNFAGFKLNPKTHDASITAKTIPATGNQYVDYTATVTVNELLGKDDEVVTAELWIGTTKVATEADVTLNASTSKLISLSFTPATAMSDDAYIKVYNGDESINLTSEVQAVTIAAATVLDETVDPGITEAGTLASVVVRYTPKDGWNTIAMPFALTDAILTDIFGAGYKIYEFKSFSANTIGFATATTFYAGYPYLVYVENAPAQEDIKLQNVSVTTTKSDTYGGVTFQSSYAPIATGSLTGNYGVTSAGEIRKAGSGASLKGFRAYFTGVPAAARIAIVDDDETTSISEELIVNREKFATAVYNLQGQKVENLKKGNLYIKNGKKVMIK